MQNTGESRIKPLKSAVATFGNSSNGQHVYTKVRSAGSSHYWIADHGGVSWLHNQSLTQPPIIVHNILAERVAINTLAWTV